MSYTLADKFGLSYEQRKELRRVCEELFERYRFEKYENASEFGFLAAEGEQEGQERDEQFAATLEYFVGKLPGPEREIVQRRYMVRYPAPDYKVEMELGISEGPYNKRRYRAFILLAEVFNLECAKSKILLETK